MHSGYQQGLVLFVSCGRRAVDGRYLVRRAIWGGAGVSNFLVLPPEINSLRIFAGAGSGPMLSAATAWDGLAAELGSAASSFNSVISGLVGQAWQGPASAAMGCRAAPSGGGGRAAAAQAENAAGLARATAAVFETAQASTVHPTLVGSNRIQLGSLITTNLFGQNAPAIAAIEAEYEQMWAQDVAAMAGYHAGASATASQLSPVLQDLESLFTNLGYGNNGV